MMNTKSPTNFFRNYHLLSKYEKWHCKQVRKEENLILRKFKFDFDLFEENGKTTF